MIKLSEPFNWKGGILEAGTEIGLGEIEDKLIASGAAERCTPGKKEEKQGPTEEDFRGLLDAYEKSQEVISELRKEIAEKDAIIADLQKPTDVENADSDPEAETEVSEAGNETETQDKPRVGRTTK